MAIVPVVGPAGGGKSQIIDSVSARVGPGRLAVIDFTMIWAAVSGAKRGPDGKYPERRAGDELLPLVQQLKYQALDGAMRRGLSGFVTGSSALDVDDLAERTGIEAIIVDPGRDEVVSRLLGPDGELSEECEQAVDRWYRPPDPRPARGGRRAVTRDQIARWRRARKRKAVSRLTLDQLSAEQSETAKRMFAAIREDSASIDARLAFLRSNRP